MIKRIKPPSPSIITYRDGLGRVHFRPTPITSELSREFQDFQTRMLKRQIPIEDSLGKLALALLAFEAIVTPADLERALMCSTHAYCYRKQQVIEWVREDKRLDRRFLSTLSAVCLNEVARTPIDVTAARAAIRNAATAVYPNRARPIDDLFGAAIAWATEALPGVLVGHVLGVAPLCALPRSALTRDETGLALMTPVGPDGNPGLADEVIGNALESYQQTPLSAGGTWAVVELVTACRHNRRVSRHTSKRDMLQECQRLSRRIGEADSLSALLLAWAGDLIESETLGLADVAPKTIQKYVSCIALPLHATVGAEDILNWSSEEYQACYNEIVAAALMGKRGNTASALSSWHSFLMRWLDAPPLLNRLHDKVEELLPAANVIWPREKARISEWLVDASGDKRLIEQLQVCVELAWGGRIRASELFYLRLHNFRCYDELLEVEIAPMLRDGKLKSNSAKRILTYRDPAAIKIIRTWYDQRHAETALESDLVFGDPHSPKHVYRLGSLYSTLNHLTKSATGDPAASLHTWGHAWISREIAEAFVAPMHADIETLDLIATAAGHLSSSTTLRHYSHVFEHAIRHHVDHYLQQIDLTSREGAHWSGVLPTTLRQRAFARGISGKEVAWSAILARPLEGSHEHIATAFAMEVPRSPLASVIADQTRFETVLSALCDISRGMDSPTVALRARREADWVDEVVQCASMVLADLGHQRRPRSETSACRFDALTRDLLSVELAIDLTRIDQAKFASLRKAMGSISSDAGKTIATAWTRCYAGPYVGLDDVDAASELFHGLSAAKISDQYLALSITLAPGQTPDGPGLVAESQLQLAFRKSFGKEALVEYKAPRRGRPKNYLIWASRPLAEQSAPPSASLSVTGFNALLFALAVFVDLSKTGDVK